MSQVKSNRKTKIRKHHYIDDVITMRTRQQLRSLLKKLEITNSELEELCGLPNKYIKLLLEGETSPTIKTTAAINNTYKRFKNI